jgi:predicted AlkP superfamily pyrophosphatase or phosphodiesterase
MRSIGLVLFVFVSFASWGQANRTPYVVLVSFDGFRYDYVNRYQTPHFHKFIQEGSHAEGLIPSFPSKTFPNHYTLVTGLYPGNHGLVDNHFYDPAAKAKYSMKDRQIVHDTSYYGGTPLWQLAKQQGIKSASFFWVGSDVKIKGMLPDYYLEYNESIPDKNRIDQTIAWLELPEKDRPHFISLYFSFTDTQGHNTGTNSLETNEAVLRADSVLGLLTKRIAKLKLAVNIIVVSDHGMLELKQTEETFITLGKLFNISDTSVVYVNGGTQAHLYTRHADSLYHVLKEKENHFKVYRRQEFPAQWHYNHPRSGDVLIVADPGYYIQEVSNSWSKPSAKNVFGAHGFDPYTVKEMQGIFYAKGPNIKRGITLPPFNNIHVYPLIAKILGLQIPVVDGDIAVLGKIVRK